MMQYLFFLLTTTYIDHFTNCGLAAYVNIQILVYNILVNTMFTFTNMWAVFESSLNAVE